MIVRGIVLGATTARNIWIRHNLEARYKRMLEQEKRSAMKGFKLTCEQIKLPEKHNPEYAERHIKTLWPGYLLSQDTFYVGTLKGVGRLYLQTAVGTFYFFALAKLYT